MVQQDPINVDVIVVGSGGAGLAAALDAKEHGATAAIVEREPEMGGATAISGGGCFASALPPPRSKLQGAFRTPPSSPWRIGCVGGKGRPTRRGPGSTLRIPAAVSSAGWQTWAATGTPSTSRRATPFPAGTIPRGAANSYGR